MRRYNNFNLPFKPCSFIYFLGAVFSAVSNLYAGFASVLLLIPYLSRARSNWVFYFWIYLLLFSGVLISFFSVNIKEKMVFDFVRGMDFIVLFLISFYLLFDEYRKDGVTPYIGRIFIIILGLLAYWFYGVIAVGFSGATTYLRYFLYPVLLVIFFKRAQPVSGMGMAFNMLFLAFFVLVFFEAIFPEEYYDLIDAGNYLNLKYDRYIPSIDYFIDSRTIEVIAYNGHYIEAYRGLGPTMHPISGAYVVGLLGLYLTVVYRSYLYFLLGFIGAFLLFSKGAILLLTFVALALILSVKLKMISARAMMLLFLLVSLFLIFFGLVTNNPHHWSLMSSLVSLPSRPLGGGIGFGGTISTGTSYSTELGESSGDSALALFMNMFGFIGLVLYVFLWFLYISKWVGAMYCQRVTFLGL